MARGPGGHKADATGPHGRGAGPGKGTGTAQAYLEVDEAVEKPTLEGKVTGPGGGVPDTKGTKGYGMGAGPGGGKGEGMGLDYQREFENIFKQYPDNETTIHSYLSYYYSEATKLNLTGTERWEYVLRKVKDRIGKEKAKAQNSKRNNTNNNLNSNKGELLEKIVGSSGGLQKEYGFIYSEHSNVDGIDEYVKKYHNEAVKKGYKGQKRRDYVNNKVKGEAKKYNNKNSSKTTSKKAA